MIIDCHNSVVRVWDFFFSLYYREPIICKVYYLRIKNKKNYINTPTIQGVTVWARLLVQMSIPRGFDWDISCSGMNESHFG